jgi:RNA polymerase sigma-70 factor (ECF subfamily)
MSADDSFAALMAGLRAGDPDAATAVFQRFTDRLIGLARRHLDSRLRAKADPEDVVQSVYKSFFRRHSAGDFTFSSWDDLWSLLARITLCKCNGRLQYWQRQRRDAAREASRGPEALDLLSGVLDSDPTPEEATALAEAVERLLRGLSPEDREAVVLSLQGYSSAEVSEQVSLSERTVRRLLQRVRKRLERMQAESAEGP